MLKPIAVPNRAVLIAAMAALLSLAMSGSGSRAGDDSGLDDLDCEELWLRRNQIYANRGFCFKTERAIDVFGRRCFPPYGRLTAADERSLAAIRSAERAKQCRVEG